MRTLLCLALALTSVAASAQVTTQTNRTTQDPYRTTFQADLDRLDREIQMLNREARTDMRSDLDGVTADYDDLRTTYDGDAISDPAAVARARQGYATRYDEISGRVYRARLDAAPNRSVFTQRATDRVDLYDQQINDLRTQYQSASADDRATYAQDLIRLRKQRDTYRDEVYSARGARSAEFNDAARRSATDRLSQLDADFRSARRDAMMRMYGMDPMTDGQMMNNGGRMNGSMNN